VKEEAEFAHRPSQPIWREDVEGGKSFLTERRKFTTGKRLSCMIAFAGSLLFLHDLEKRDDDHPRKRKIILISFLRERERRGFAEKNLREAKRARRNRNCKYKLAKTEQNCTFHPQKRRGIASHVQGGRGKTVPSCIRIEKRNLCGKKKKKKNV